VFVLPSFACNKNPAECLNFVSKSLLIIVIIGFQKIEPTTPTQKENDKSDVTSTQTKNNKIKK
jgi:hypothetical protein